MSHFSHQREKKNAWSKWNTTQDNIAGVLFKSLGSIYLLRSKNFVKINISYSLRRRRSCVYQGVRNVSFSENFANVLNGWSLMLMILTLTKMVKHLCWGSVCVKRLFFVASVTQYFESDTLEKREFNILQVISCWKHVLASEKSHVCKTMFLEWVL